MDDGNPAISVIIPTFNRAKRLVGAIESVLRQTYDDYEIIVVDDGSTDGTAEVVAQFGDRVRYLYQDNRGASEARNRGIEAARGQWIATLDSDDIWLPQKLELQMELLAQFGADCGLCFTNCFMASRPRTGPTLFDDAGFQFAGRGGILEQPVDYIFSRHYLFHTSSLIVARRLIEGRNGFDTAMVVAEDTDLLFRLCLRTRFCFVNAPLVCVNDLSTSVGERLTDHFKSEGNVAFESKMHMYNKWLPLTEANVPVRARVLNARRQTCMDRLAATLKRRRWRDGMHVLGQMVYQDRSLYKPLALVGSRLMRYLFRSLG